jgi:hypothetical protein
VNRRQNPLRSRLADVRRIFERLPAASISEKFQSCSPKYDSVRLRRRMEEQDFDIYGIKVGVRVVGYVDRRDLSVGPCGQYQRRFDRSEVIPASTRLTAVLPMLWERPRLLVSDRRRIIGIIARGDLQKAPLRMLAFAVVSLIEAHLLRLIRTHYVGDAWQSHLPENRLRRAEHLFRQRQARNEEIDLLDCLQLCDKRDLLLEQPLLAKIGLGRGEALATLKMAEEIRNRLAHAQDLVAGLAWPDVIDVLARNELLLERLEACA